MPSTPRTSSGRLSRGRTRAVRALGVLLAVLFVASSCKDSTGNTTVESVRFATLPSSVVAGEPFTVVVELLNPAGDIADGSGASVGLRLIGSATLNGTTTVNAVRGVATFEGLTLNTASTTYLLEAEVGTGANAIMGQSSGFAVTAAAANSQQSTAEAPETPLFPFGPTEMTFTFKDQFGNPLRNAAVSMTASLAGSTLDPSSGTTDGAGRFLTNFDPGGEGNVTFSATISGQTFSFSTAFAAVDQCPPAALTFPGTTAGSVPAGSCAMDGRPASSHRLVMPAAGGASFAANAAFPAILEVQTEPPGSNVRLLADNNVAVEWLLPAGTYRFRIATAAAPGAYQVTGAAVPGNTGQVPRVLVAAGTYTGQILDANDVPLGDGSFYDEYYLFSTRRCTITLRSTVFDSYLFIINANTREVAFEDDDSGGGLDAQVVLTPCAIGGSAVGVIANHWPGAMGAYTMTISFTAPAAVRAGIHASPTAEMLFPGLMASRPGIRDLSLSRRKK